MSVLELGAMTLTLFLSAGGVTGRRELLITWLILASLQRIIENLQECNIVIVTDASSLWGEYLIDIKLLRALFKQWGKMANKRFGLQAASFVWTQSNGKYIPKQFLLTFNTLISL